MLRFNEDFENQGEGKSLCECWYCGYCPIPGEPKDMELYRREEVYCKGYFSSLDEIYDAFRFEFTYYLYRHKAREDTGHFTFEGKEYTFAYVYDLGADLCWVEIKDFEGQILYGKDTKSYKYFFGPNEVWGEPIVVGHLDRLPFNPYAPKGVSEEKTEDESSENFPF